MKFVTAAISGSLIYMAIPVSYVLDFAFFDRQMNIIELFGVALILVVNVTLGILKGKGII